MYIVPKGYVHWPSSFYTLIILSYLYVRYYETKFLNYFLQFQIIQGQFVFGIIYCFLYIFIIPRDCWPKFATGLNMIIGCSSKSIWLTRLLFCQNGSPMRRSFWQKNSFITHILFELQPIIIFSPVANFGNQSIVIQCGNQTDLPHHVGGKCTLWGPKLSLENVLVCRKYIDLKGLVTKAKYLWKISFDLSFLIHEYHALIIAKTLPRKIDNYFFALFYHPLL